MFRFFVFITFFSLNYFVLGQFPANFQFNKIQVDSIRFQVEKNRTLEMILPQEIEVHEAIGSTLLSAKECTQFIKKIGKNSTYENGRALLTHDNLTFTCYADTSQLIVQLSTLTRNIDINGFGETYYGKFSKKFGKFLIQLLMHYDWYDPTHEIGDLEGIED